MPKQSVKKNNKKISIWQIVGIMATIVTIASFIFNFIFGWYNIKDICRQEKPKSYIITDTIKIDSAQANKIKSDSIHANKDNLKVNSLSHPNRLRKTYDIFLVLPPSMINAEIFVDKKQANIIERAQFFIKIRVFEKADPHQIKVLYGKDTCITSISILENKLKIYPCIGRGKL